jgi:hypothetical protein
LTNLLCYVEKKFAKHIGPQEFVQCSSNLIKQQLNYDVPASTSSSSSNSKDTRKKTCNLESYFEWSNRLRLIVVNEILQVRDDDDDDNLNSIFIDCFEKMIEKFCLFFFFVVE